MRIASLSLFLALLATALAPLAHADDTMRGSVEQSEQPSGKAGLDYVSIENVLLNMRNIGLQDKTANSLAAELVLGTYLSDYFKLEMRFAQGYGGSAAPYPGLEVRIRHYVSWYLGLQYPWTDYSDVYAQFGFSSVYGHADLGGNTNNYPKISSGLLNSSFSASWLVGTDLKIFKHTYVMLEAGKLHDDTDTKITTWHVNTGLRYEF